jgi:hypothetical protein
MVPQNLTPLTFENGVLLGWGNDFYRYVLRRLEETRKLGEAAPKPKVQENKSLEKAIEKIETRPTRSTPVPPATSQSQKSPPPKKSQGEDNKSDKKKGEGGKEKKDPLDDEDRKRIDEESEQNFDFW